MPCVAIALALDGRSERRAFPSSAFWPTYGASEFIGSGARVAHGKMAMKAQVAHERCMVMGDARDGLWVMGFGLSRGLGRPATGVASCGIARLV